MDPLPSVLEPGESSPLRMIADSRPSQIRASHSLLSLSHTLKLLHLFADSATPASVLERLSSSLASDIAALKLTASGSDST